MGELLPREPRYPWVDFSHVGGGAAQRPRLPRDRVKELEWFADCINRNSSNGDFQPVLFRDECDFVARGGVYRRLALDDGGILRAVYEPFLPGNEEERGQASFILRGGERGTGASSCAGNEEERNGERGQARRSCAGNEEERGQALGPRGERGGTRDSANPTRMADRGLFIARNEGTRTGASSCSLGRSRPLHRRALRRRSAR